MRNTAWLGIALIAVCAGAQAQGIHKCVGKDGKTAYSNAPCPGSKEIEAPRVPAAKGADAKKGSAAGPAAAGGAVVPDMQPGKWKLRFTRDGRAKDEETCGDPIDGMRREVQEYAAKAGAKWGCTMTTTGAGGRNVKIVYDCPSDRSPEGLPVSKGRTDLSVVSASPQVFRIEMKSTVFGGYVMEGARIGNCP